MQINLRSLPWLVAFALLVVLALPNRADVTPGGHMVLGGAETTGIPIRCTNAMRPGVRTQVGMPVEVVFQCDTATGNGAAPSHVAGGSNNVAAGYYFLVTDVSTAYETSNSGGYVIDLYALNPNEVPARQHGEFQVTIYCEYHATCSRQFRSPELIIPPGSRLAGDLHLGQNDGGRTNVSGFLVADPGKVSLAF